MRLHATSHTAQAVQLSRVWGQPAQASAGLAANGRAWVVTPSHIASSGDSYTEHAVSDTVQTYLQGVHMHVLEKLMPLPPQIPQLLTLGEAANRLAVSKRHLQRLVTR